MVVVVEVVAILFVVGVYCSLVVYALYVNTMVASFLAWLVGGSHVEIPRKLTVKLFVYLYRIPHRVETHKNALGTTNPHINNSLSIINTNN